MGRVLVIAVLLAVGLLAAGIALDVVAPRSGWSVAPIILSCIVFAVVVWIIFARAWRTKGWSIRHPGRFDDRTPLE